MQKPKRENKSREQLIVEADNKKEVTRKRELIVDSFYPALIGATVSVDEAKSLVNAIGTLLMEEVLKTMRDRQFTEVIENLHANLCRDGERSVEIQALLDTLKGENLFVAREIIEGMTRAIETMIMEEMRSRKLDTLKTGWDRYLN
jgi:hypothetical protein